MSLAPRALIVASFAPRARRGCTVSARPRMQCDTGAKCQRCQRLKQLALTSQPVEITGENRLCQRFNGINACRLYRALCARSRASDKTGVDSVTSLKTYFSLYLSMAWLQQKSQRARPSLLTIARAGFFGDSGDGRRRDA